MGLASNLQGGISLIYLGHTITVFLLDPEISASGPYSGVCILLLLSYDSGQAALGFILGLAALDLFVGLALLDNTLFYFCLNEPCTYIYLFLLRLHTSFACIRAGSLSF